MKTLLHWWRLFVEPSSMSRLRGLGPKRWQVLYLDGCKTVPMGYDEACNYRNIFGGTVIRYVK